MFNRWVLVKFILCFLLFLELFFWVGAWVTQSAQYWSNSILSHHKGVYRIMCIGESNTYAGGNDAYPAQLERILNADSTSRKFQVINQGVAGATSSMILGQLEHWLDLYHPDMVIAMIGINDSDTRGPIRGRPLSILEKCKLYQLTLELKKKIFKAFDALVQKGSVRSASIAKKDEQPVLEYDAFKEALNKQTDDQKKLYMLIQIARGLGHERIAGSLYEKFLANNMDTTVRNWVIKDYGHLLVNIGEYEKFLSVMHQIPYDAWPYELVRGYCHSPLHLENMRYVVEDIFERQGHDTAVYGYLASCFDEGGERAKV